MILEHREFTGKKKTLPFLLSKPTYYGEEPPPLILFLHGRGERGTNLNLLKKYGIPKKAGAADSFPFITISPQCPEDSEWADEADTLKELLLYCIQAFHADPDRVYVTGLSMGGAGTWNLAIQYPHMLTAIAPVCGKTQPEKAAGLRNLPIWVFHGEKDDIIPVEESQSMVHALQKEKAEVRITIYPDAGHDSWSETYDNDRLYEWFLQYNNSENYK
ncbi:prolyl oligopeptidase family serine peptidase [Fictibacillus sp. FJAT-27399]|uniref:carboxylesterase family protein n=1 Tax=Fictibacillus sp. FJAT-27399 TaxID=1729689 RepID=UPI0007808785|nr:prolyl oligopeptidase family serine peptidase [Fictibacillus sp. FJAT-27399]